MANLEQKYGDLAKAGDPAPSTGGVMLLQASSGDPLIALEQAKGRAAVAREERLRDQARGETQRDKARIEQLEQEVMKLSELLKRR